MWILSQFKEKNIEETVALNDKLWIIPQDKLKRELESKGRIKSFYVLTVIFSRIMKKSSNPTISDFATELAEIMSKLETKNKRYRDSKLSLEDKLERLRDILKEYTKAKSVGKLPRVSRVLLRVTNLKACEIGNYSLDLSFGNTDRVVANNLVITDAEVDLMILNKPPFECEITDPPLSGQRS